MQTTEERFLPGKMGYVIETEHLNRYYYVINQFDLQDKIVLDIASGEGYGSNILAKYSAKVIGVDISHEAIKHAKGKYNAPNLQFKYGSASEIPLEDHSVDLVVSFETIEHHTRHEEMLQEIKRVLKADGVLIMSSPNKKEYTDVPNHHNQYHVRELYTNEFVNLISKHFRNLKLLWQRYFDGSMIMSREGYFDQIPFCIDENTQKSLDSMYDVIIATDNSEISIKHPIVIYQNTSNEWAAKYNSIVNSHAYKLGVILLSPIYFIKNNIFKR